MAETTGIAWTRSTFNPWMGCTKVGPGCDHCYAAVSPAAKFHGVVWGNDGERRLTAESTWANPMRWQKDAAWEKANGRFRQPTWAAKWDRPGFWPVFCASLADVFDKRAEQGWRDALWDLIEATPDLTWLLLTKRIGNVGGMIPDRWSVSLPSNIWLGATIVNQDEADRDLPKLLQIKCHKRFVSDEPALGSVNWRRVNVGGNLYLDALTGKHFGEAEGHDLKAAMDSIPSMPRPYQNGIDWIIAGGENSNRGQNPARPFNIEWARDTLRQCREVGTAFLMKQMGSYATDGEGNRIKFKHGSGADPVEWPEDLRVQEFPI